MTATTHEVVELTRVQGTIAKRMSESRATVPDFTVRTAVDMESAATMKTELAVSLNDLIIKACALALREHPLVNGSYVDGTFALHGRVNVGFAVAAPGSLIVPVVRDADKKSVAAIAAETHDLVRRVREGGLRPSDVTGGTFTVSNLGMFGVEDFEAVINTPQAAILSVGQTKDQPVAIDGKVVVRSIARLALSCDHRILYGADAARFLGHVRDLLEKPKGALDHD